jgi:hypothetical protein
MDYCSKHHIKIPEEKDKTYVLRTILLAVLWEKPLTSLGAGCRRAF